ncbi:hypothetical protein SAMN06265367_103428 [Algoriphagus winogradskyi]|uniref:VCBS repeat-containing protein n=2 Tax=Algoriphagus winogradskyi TaxID=237017 RepID=A0ABY1P0X3_9BACT|nr:hypothetical protein SAMN06265367_103428 [Algoriphagus winogradskyi]
MRIMGQEDQYAIPFRTIRISRALGHMTKKISMSLILILIGVACYAQKDINVVKWTMSETQFELKVFSDYEMDVARPNTEIILFRNGQEIIKDSISIYNGYFENRFEDMNSDGFNDILIYQGSGARANETYNLYIYQANTNDFKKVIAFNEYPNISPTDEKGVLVSMILTGVVDYKFFFLKDNGELIDLRITVIDENRDGKEYEKGLKEAKKYVAQNL